MSEEVKVEKKDEDWMQKKWRPAMGWMYMLVCTLDMAVFPVLWSVGQVLLKQPVTQWQPLTLQGAGLFHLAMGAVLGIAAFGRTQEKIAGAAVNPTPAPTSFPAPSTGGFSSPTPPAPTQTFAPPPSPPSFGGGFGGPASITTTASGKKIVPDEPQPVL
jgi:hypothetical protein